MPQKETKGRDVRLNVAANLLESKGAEKLPRSAAYVFAAGGRLLARKALDEKGAAALSFRSADQGSRVRVLVGPDVDEKDITVDGLLRRGATEKSVRVDAGNLTPSLDFQIIPSVWKCWLLGLCFVRGTLLKRVNSGGVSLDLPVCNATVEVYEVDPLFILIPKLPDIDIERIRDFILNPPPLPDPPIELPGPFPPFDGPVPVPGPDPAPDFRLSRNVRTTSLTTNAATADTAHVTQISLAGATDLQFQARTASIPALRNILINHAELVRPIFCILFPRLVTTQLVATATTDECGHFQTFFFRGCLNPDTPDLYFKAKQRLFGFFDVTIYAPTPIACYTHWNYVCGTEVTLITTNPLARTCPPCPPIVAPNNWVLVMAIGNHPLSRIRGTGQTLQGTTNATNIGLTDGDAPFGGLLRLRIEFDNSLRDDLDVKFYRVSWRQGTSGTFTPLTDECHRHFTHEVGGDLILEVLSLGPQVVGAAPNLFEIPPALPPLGQYSFPDLREDLTNAKFPTNTFAPPAQAGKYQLKIDLFDSTGALVNVATKGIKYRVPTSTDLSGTIFTEDAAALGLVQDDDGDGLNSFIMTLHVDNNVCSASIAAPLLNGSVAADDCGVLNYQDSDTVTMSYTASHPNAFATYSFAVVRGVSPVVASASGNANTGTPFSIVDTVNNLRSPDCPVAGFSENLYVAAMATNGWERLSGYDASAVRAFVLAPQS
ncbi:MAG: hypothetical protein JST85_04670 [Acidobacteria bacterium]|nr:hypothetical protein [Acidobacteriota bacterium]